MSGDARRTTGEANPAATPIAPPSELAALPARPSSSLTGDLASDTDDVAALKQRLERARDRLSFYESFDRIIQENIRRSSELMMEATELHEKAQQAAAEQARAQATLAERSAEQRAHYAALLGDLRTELDRTRVSLERIADRVTSALDALGNDAPPAHGTAQPDSNAASPGRPPTVEPTLAKPPAASAPPDAETAAYTDGTAARPAAPSLPHQIEVLVHGVPTARVAISLQNHLRGLDQVSGVEAREFVEGLLRLQVTSTAPLDAGTLAGWRDGAGSDTIRALPDLLEISLPGTTER